MADEATLRIVVQDASVGQSPPPDDAPPLTPYQSAPPPSFSQQTPPTNAYQSQPPVPTPRAAPRPSSPTDDPYEQARRLRESQIQREQVKAAYDQMYGTAEKASSIFDGVLDAAQKMRGTLGGVFGPLVGALLDIYAATREAKREDGNAIRAEAERRNLLKPEMVFQRQAEATIQQKRQEESTPTSVGPIQSDAIMAEAREALLALGNSQIEADKLLRQVMDNANATFATVQDVIRAAYQNKGASNASATQPQAASTPMPSSTTPVPTPPPIKKASGGEVPIVGGIPASADEVPIKATAGEFIVRKDEAQKPANKSMLQAMNSGADVASHFDKGGQVALPDVVYHGTKADFPLGKIKTDRQLGAHFGTLDQAKHFAGSEGKIHAAKLDINNPLRMEDSGEWTLHEVKDQLDEKGIALPEGVFEEYFERQKAGRDLARSGNITGNEASRNLRVWESSVIQDSIKAAGYDGIVYRNQAEGIDDKGLREYMKANDIEWDTPEYYEAEKKFGAADSYIAFNASQISPVEAQHKAAGGEIEKPSLFSKAKSAVSSVLNAPAKAKDWMTDRYGAGSSAAALAFGNAATWAATPLALSTIGMPLPPGTGIATGILAAELRHQFKSKETIQKEKERDAQIKAAQDKMIADDSAKVGRLPKFDDSGASHFDRGGEIRSRNRLPHFARNGIVQPDPHVSPHSDNVPIAATAGEYVVTRDAASRPENRQALDSMNRGAAPTPQAQPDMIDLIMKSIVNPMIGVREMEPWSLESTQLSVLASIDALKSDREIPTPNAPGVPNVAPSSDNPISVVPSGSIDSQSSTRAIPVARTAQAGIANGPLPVAATALKASTSGVAVMAAKAVPYIGTVVAVAETLAKTFGALNSAVNETVTKYADLNPAVAQAQARAEMTAIFGDIRRANEAAPQLTRYIEVQSRLQQQYEDMKIQLLKKFIDSVEPIMDLLDKVLPLMPNMLRILDAAFPLIGLIAEAAAFIASFLPQQAQPTFEDPVDIILNRPEQIQMPPNVGG